MAGWVPEPPPGLIGQAIDGLRWPALDTGDDPEVLEMTKQARAVIRGLRAWRRRWPRKRGKR